MAKGWFLLAGGRQLTARLDRDRAIRCSRHLRWRTPLPRRRCGTSRLFPLGANDALAGSGATCRRRPLRTSVRWLKPTPGPCDVGAGGHLRLGTREVGERGTRPRREGVLRPSSERTEARSVAPRRRRRRAPAAVLSRRQPPPPLPALRAGGTFRIGGVLASPRRFRWPPLRTPVTPPT